MVRAFDRGGIRFATWVGHGRDPEVAYLDAAQLVIGAAELTAEGWVLFDAGRTYNVLGGRCDGPIDRAILHRISHTVVDGRGSRSLLLDDAERTCGRGLELCDVAVAEVLPAMPYQEPGNLHLGADFALQWVTWDDGLRADVLRRAVYLDDHYLMEAGLGRDGRIRVWPARGLLAPGLALVTPTAQEAARIEERLSRVSTSPS